MRRQIIELEDEGQALTEDDADDTEVELGTEATTAEYEVLQAMADIDHAVHDSIHVYYPYSYAMVAGSSW